MNRYRRIKSVQVTLVIFSGLTALALDIMFFTIFYLYSTQIHFQVISIICSTIHGATLIALVSLLLRKTRIQDTSLMSTLAQYSSCFAYLSCMLSSVTTAFELGFFVQEFLSKLKKYVPLDLLIVGIVLAVSFIFTQCGFAVCFNSPWKKKWENYVNPPQVHLIKAFEKPTPNMYHDPAFSQRAISGLSQQSRLEPIASLSNNRHSLTESGLIMPQLQNTSDINDIFTTSSPEPLAGSNLNIALYLKKLHNVHGQVESWSNDRGERNQGNSSDPFASYTSYSRTMDKIKQTLPTISGSPPTDEQFGIKSLERNTPTQINTLVGRNHSFSRSHYSDNSSPLATPISNPSELNIHPLFRAASKSPPLIAPGTVVTAAPGADQIILDQNRLLPL